MVVKRRSPSTANLQHFKKLTYLRELVFGHILFATKAREHMEVRYMIYDYSPLRVALGPRRRLTSGNARLYSDLPAAVFSPTILSPCNRTEPSCITFLLSGLLKYCTEAGGPPEYLPTSGKRAHDLRFSMNRAATTTTVTTPMYPLASFLLPYAWRIIAPLGSYWRVVGSISVGRSVT